MPNTDNDGEGNLVLTASVHDVRYFVALLRGVNFANRATVNVAEGGLTIMVEEARTLLATAFIFAPVFDEFEHHPERAPPSSQQSSDSEGDDIETQNTAFEIPLNTLIECLNIFGTAGGSSTSTTTKYRRWRRPDDSDHEDQNDEGQGPSGRNQSRSGTNKGLVNSRIDQHFGSERGTGMRLSYTGAGHPLTLLIAEDSNGPTATCEITTYEPEPLLELDFNEDPTVLKIILKSSWLRDALSELDPSCDKLTIIGNPPPPPGRAPQTSALPRLRLQAAGTFGSTEMDYPSDKEVLETCECDQSVSFSYRFNYILCAMRALQSSTKTSLRINERGLLCLQFLMPSPRPRGGDRSDAFIEFRCLALDDDV
ncbi:hypothetical protein AcW1_005304 [Taiwanofungus camphoratus]|nr:hypothetical protein AcW1_005304 [Antrodia cinnamomea]